jgi:hypothetical protein
MVMRRKGLHEDGDEVGAASLVISTRTELHSTVVAPVRNYTQAQTNPTALLATSSRNVASVTYQDDSLQLPPRESSDMSVEDPESREVENSNLSGAVMQEDTASTTTHENASGIHALDAITRDEMATQVRAQLRVQLEREIQSEAVIAQVIQEEEDKSFWTKRRLIVFGGISLLAIVDIVIGVVIATRTNEETYLKGNATIPGKNTDDRFAEDIAMSRDASTLAAVAREGHYVKVFRPDHLSSWIQIGQTLEFEYDVDNKLGGRVDLSGNGSILVVARWNSRGSSGNLRVGMAQAYMYDQGKDVWEKLGQTLEGSSTDDHFGYSVALSDKHGLTLAVGSRQGDPNGLNEAGYVRVFSYNGTSPESSGQWIQIGSDMTGFEAREQFGISLALAENGRRVAVGSVGGTARNGIVRVFDFDGDWKQVGQSIKGDLDKDDANIVEMSASGSTLVIAADGDDDIANFEGYKRTFVLEGCCLWKQDGPDITGTSRNIALSSDASCLLEGTPSSNDKKGGGTLLRWSSIDSQWKQIAAARGDNVGDELGSSVAISENCSWFALGANQKSIPDLPPGYLRVYQVDDHLLIP